MSQKLIGAMLGAALCGIVCVALILVAGHWIGTSMSAENIGRMTLLAAILGLGLIAAGLHMRQLRRGFLGLPSKRK